MEFKSGKSPKSVNLALLATLKYPPIDCNPEKSPRLANESAHY